MNEYKHGDWYCEQANEAEAKEIIERAVASGAENAGGWIGTSVTCFYGVFNGYVSCNAPEDYINGNQYTIEQVREKFPLPSEYSQEWNGEGLPPVGAVCELINRGITVEIIAHAEAKARRFAVFKYYDSNGLLTVDLREAPSFNPLRSERDRWVSEAQKHCTEFSNNQLGKLYDAIKSGDLKAPSSDK